jgi:hypothetical protein|tara:strand:+ start:8193 stop:8504 length:312 start_codon:yes stop_codon:yes gene_type:complete
MSYQLYDVNGYKGDLTNNQGLEDLREVVTNKPVTYKNFLDFINAGATFITEPLMKEIVSFISDEPDGDVKKVVRNLKQLLIDSSVVAIITSNPDEGDLTAEDI